MDEQTNLRIIALQHAVNRQGPSTEYETVRIAEVYLAFLDGSAQNSKNQGAGNVSQNRPLHSDNG